MRDARAKLLFCRSRCHRRYHRFLILGFFLASEGTLKWLGYWSRLVRCIKYVTVVGLKRNVLNLFASLIYWHYRSPYQYIPLFVGSPRSSQESSKKSSSPGKPLAESSRPTSARSKSSKRSSHNSLPPGSDDEHKEEESDREEDEKQSTKSEKEKSSSSSSSLSSSSSSSSDSSDDEKPDGEDEVPATTLAAGSEDEPPAVQVHVSNGNEACLLTKGSHGLLICKFYEYKYSRQLPQRRTPLRLALSVLLRKVSVLYSQLESKERR